ncbi:MAG: 5'/3'-nucleotidase SurE [Haloarculaceae archaeon]
MDESVANLDGTPRVLLTNDDGIDAPGIAALYEELTAVADVTVVAPVENQSGVGRTRSDRARREDHPWGTAVAGTPADCVAYGAGNYPAFDLVVSGCNHGPNVGNYVVGRSGTVGACIEASFLGIPAVAVSAYHCEDFFLEPPAAYDFGRPARVARELVVRALSADAFASADILNANVPVDVADLRMRVTEPYHDYDVHVEHDPDGDAADATPDWKAERDGPNAGPGDDGAAGGDGDGSDAADGESAGGAADGESAGGAASEEVALQDAVWPGTVGWENPFPAGDDLRERYPVGSDRRALVDGEVSVSPLTAPATATDTPELDAVVAGFNESATRREQAGGD